ncbi:MAG: 50S ribosomal protein L10 [Methanosarcinaceae archaeon]|nr:50S ribosomal protein L10 [Methanosarcinaceae archaeon]
MKKSIHGTEHIPKWKIDEIQNIKDLIASHSMFGVVSIEGIMAKQIQNMRRNLHDSTVLKVSRNTLIKRAIEEYGGDVSKMADYPEGQTALIFTNDSPFKLYKKLEKTQTPSPIKAGAIAPDDIVVEKGPTGFPPGPILSVLQSAGIPVGVEAGKIAVKETKTVCKAGEKVSSKLAMALAKLDINPLKVGLILRAAYEDGIIYMPDDLAIDESEYFDKFVFGAQSAFNLSVNASYPTRDTIESIISKAQSEAFNLGVEAVILEKGVIDTLIAKADSEMFTVAGIAAASNPDAVDAEITDALGAAASSAASTQSESVSDAPVEEESGDEGEEESSSTEDGFAGLGALFG